MIVTLCKRVRVLAKGSHENMAGFVIRGDLLLFIGEEHGLALRAHQDLVLGGLEVEHVDCLAVEASRGKGSLVHHVRKVGTGESRCSASEDVQVDVFRHRNLFRVDAKNFFAALDVGTVDDNATVETARTKQGRIENVGTVGRGDQDHAIIRLEAVHLNKELVQSLLTLIVSAAKACATVTSYSIDLVDEDDAGSILLALLEEVADAACADADEHLHEVRAGDREEGNIRFTGYRAGEQRLACTGRSDEQHALGDATAKALELLGLAEELDDLLQLFLGLVNTGDILECDLLLLHGEQARAALAEAHRLVAAGLHLAQAGRTTSQAIARMVQSRSAG